MTPSTTVLQLSTMVPPDRFGGAERVVAAFAEQLQLAGFRVHNQGLKARREDAGPALPIRNLYWPFDGRSRGSVQRTAWHAVDALTLAATKQVERILDDVAPDIVVTHNLRGWGLAPWVAAQRRGLPLVHVVHDYGLLCNSSTLWRGGTACDKLCAPCRPRADMARRRWPGGVLVGVSEAVLHAHTEFGFDPPGRRAIVHPVAAAHDSGSGRRRGTVGRPAAFGYLGRLSEEKGINLLLDAVAGTDTTLVVAGAGAEPVARPLKARAPEVQWRGWTDPAAFFHDIDVLVVPSQWREPFGLVVVEAARAGVPVLTADQPGLVEAARASGARHLSFPASDVTALRAALQRPLSDYRSGEASPTTDIVDVVRRLVPEHPRSNTG